MDTTTGNKHTATRVMAILQLCIAFSLLLWVLAGPFMSEYFSYRSSLLLYEAVIGRDNVDSETKAARDVERFLALPQHRRLRIERAYHHLEATAERGFIAKLTDAFRALLVDFPMFAQAWLFLSIILSILLLKRRDGASLAAWVLPLLALCYGFDNIQNGTEPAEAADIALIPNEEYLVQKYFKEPMALDIDRQREQLQEAWNLFLVQEWGQEAPSENTKVFTEQLERGEHAFHVARLEKRLDAQEKPLQRQFPRQSRAILALYVLWNILFAYTVNRRGA